ncbi:hypothetical protein M0R45_026058 [Rubus argutus]|uniref:Uncharacterized protein n=1 Tax=Rubus argutus TaxID=59490 RepID=A0AAW1WVX8_RUBAR
MSASIGSTAIPSHSAAQSVEPKLGLSTTVSPLLLDPQTTAHTAQPARGVAVRNRRRRELSTGRAAAARELRRKSGQISDGSSFDLRAGLVSE